MSLAEVQDDSLQLESAAEFRRRLGGISKMTEWRWARQYADFPKVIWINNRKYYRTVDRQRFTRARAAEAGE